MRPSMLPHVIFAAVAIAQVELDTESYSNLPRFEREVLTAHNRWRAEYGAVPLVWNDTLENFSRNYTKGCVFRHSGAAYGENLAAGFTNVTAAIDAWGDERDVYDFSRAEFSEETGHFTQMVWKATRSVGCATLKCDGLLAGGLGSWFITCEYWPRGNIKGTFAHNVAVRNGSVDGGESGAQSGAGGSAVDRWVASVGVGMGSVAVVLGCF